MGGNSEGGGKSGQRFVEDSGSWMKNIFLYPLFLSSLYFTYFSLLSSFPFSSSPNSSNPTQTVFDASQSQNQSYGSASDQGNFKAHHRRVSSLEGQRSRTGWSREGISKGISQVGSNFAGSLLSQSYRVLIPILFISFTYFSHAIPRWIFPSSTIFALLGKAFAFSYACVIDGYYLFDPYWASKGWGFDKRVDFLESHYAYFFGFGFVLTLLSFIPSSLVISFAIFSLLYPFQVLSVLYVGEKVLPKFPEYPELGLDLSSSSYPSSSYNKRSGPPPRINRHKPSDSITLIRSEMGDGGEDDGDLSGMSGSSSRMHPIIPIKLPVLALAVIGFKGLNKLVDEVRMMINNQGGGKKKKKVAEGSGFRSGSGGNTFGGNYQFGNGSNGATASYGDSFRNYTFGSPSANVAPPPPPKSTFPPPPPPQASSTTISPQNSAGETVGRRKVAQPMDNQRFI